MTAYLVSFVVTGLLIVLAVLLVARHRRSRPRPPAILAEPDWRDGVDYQVRRAIEDGASDQLLRMYAENVAIREWNASLTDQEAQYRADAHQINLYTGLRPAEPAPPNVTPALVIHRHPACRKCQFEMAIMWGGEVAIPILTAACPEHQEEP